MSDIRTRVCDVVGTSDVVGLLGDLVNNCLGVLDGVGTSDVGCSPLRHGIMLCVT